MLGITLDELEDLRKETRRETGVNVATVDKADKKTSETKKIEVEVQQLVG